jgi:non-ribosomal peptide synthetase component F
MSACDALRHVLVGGEALPPALAARFQQRLPHAHLHNAYGPTETTVDATGDGMAGVGVHCTEAAVARYLTKVLQPCRL